MNSLRDKKTRSNILHSVQKKKTAPHKELASELARVRRSSSSHDRPETALRTLVARGWGQCPAAHRVGARRRNVLCVGVNGRVVWVAGFDTEDATDGGDDEAEREDYEIEHCAGGKMGLPGEGREDRAKSGTGGRGEGR